ncbi:hypothetical protein FOZ61_005363 [Perkinsus olseni]|uniref:Uncharacterized protein n=1 Tax=Perkinsus olseni TaxID=32597 RepID=A0A7J6MIY1_PEROL|nr:hypothetical protein FOZ61_005363 [Perkinsus olseni]KAF4676608.1 hypothetical protein FOL46_000071 [Perkinsus olseni]
MAENGSSWPCDKYTDIDEKLIDAPVPEKDPSKFLLELLHGNMTDDTKDSGEGSVYSAPSSSSGGDTVDVYSSIDDFFRRQRKHMEICIYRQFMMRSGGGSDPIRVRRICSDLVHRTFEEVREARLIGPSSLTHRTMQRAD